MQKTLVSVRECMVELQIAAIGMYRHGLAGDALNTAY